MTVRNNKFHHTVFHPYEEIEDNKSYKIFEYSRLSSGMIQLLILFIYEYFIKNYLFNIRLAYILDIRQRETL